MSTCNGCGGVVGRDCYNPQECEWISRDQQARAMAREYAQPDDDRISALEAEVFELRAIITATIPAAPAPTDEQGLTSNSLDVQNGGDLTIKMEQSAYPQPQEQP